MNVQRIWMQNLVLDPRLGNNTATAEFNFAGEHVLVQVALCQVSTFASVSITKFVDSNGGTRGIDEFLSFVELEHATQVEVTLSADQGVVAAAVATAFIFD